MFKKTDKKQKKNIDNYLLFKFQLLTSKNSITKFASKKLNILKKNETLPLQQHQNNKNKHIMRIELC